MKKKKTEEREKEKSSRLILRFPSCNFQAVAIIIIIIISFMRGIYTYIPETNHDPREYSVSSILSLLFMVPISLVHALALILLLG